MNKVLPNLKNLKNENSLFRPFGLISVGLWMRLLRFTIVTLAMTDHDPQTGSDFCCARAHLGLGTRRVLLFLCQPLSIFFLLLSSLITIQVRKILNAYIVHGLSFSSSFPWKCHRNPPCLFILRIR